MRKGRKVLPRYHPLCFKLQKPLADSLRNQLSFDYGGSRVFTIAKTTLPFVTKPDPTPNIIRDPIYRFCNC